MLILFQAAVTGLLRQAEPGLFCTRFDAFCLLAGTPASLLSAGPATYADLGATQSDFRRDGLLVISTGRSCTWCFRLPTLLGDRDNLFP
jgi:hypothetical protein